MTLPQETRQGHPYFMYDAIIGQPEAMAMMLERHAHAAAEVAAQLSSRRNIYIVGIGTSWHAVLVAEHWFRHFAGPGIQVQGWHSFEFCGYPPSLGPEDAVIIISHRGTKTYSFLALELARERGAFTVAVTSTDPGPRLHVAEVSLHTVSPERSSAFTISYTTALTVLAMMASELGAALGNDSETAQLKDRLLDVPGAVADVVDREEAIADVARKYGDRQRFISVGWGPNTGNAYEVALKIKETSASDCEGLQVEQLLHGPFCSVDDRCLVTLIAPPGPGVPAVPGHRPGLGRRRGAGLGAGSGRRRGTANPGFCQLCHEASPRAVESPGRRRAAAAVHLPPGPPPGKAPGPVPAGQPQAGCGAGPLRSVANNLQSRITWSRKSANARKYLERGPGNVVKLKIEVCQRTLSSFPPAREPRWL